MESNLSRGFQPSFHNQTNFPFRQSPFLALIHLWKLLQSEIENICVRMKLKRCSVWRIHSGGFSVFEFLFNQSYQAFWRLSDWSRCDSNSLRREVKCSLLSKFVTNLYIVINFTRILSLPLWHLSKQTLQLSPWENRFPCCDPIG